MAGNYAMVVGSPLPEPSWSPAGGPPEAAPAEPDRHGSAPAAPTERALDLALVRAAIRDGLLMVFGPEDDPVPPQAFGAAAAERPDAEVRLMDGPRVRAERVAAVLDAQMSGRLGSGLGGGEPWIRAMLGIAPQPEMAGSHDLSAETCTLDVVAFGKELMITSRGGATFLIADARARTPDSICVWVGSEGPIAPGALADRLLGGPRQDSVERNPSELTMPGCKAWLEDDALLLDLPEIGPVYLAHIGDAGATAPAASLFTASGEVATIGDLLNALSGPVPHPAAPEQADRLAPAAEPVDDLPAPSAQSGADDPSACAVPLAIALPDALAVAMQQAQSLPAAAERLDDFGPSPVPCAAGAPTAHAVPLTIALPDALAAAPERIVLVVMRGLPEGASLSAGVASGDGSWLLSPRDLPGLSLTPPRDWASNLSLEIAAIALASAEGELTATASTTVVPWRSAVVEPGPAFMDEPAPSATLGSASSRAEHEPAASVGSASSWVVEPARTSIPLDLDLQILGEGGPFDAFIVRGLPAGVSLSAGTYDPAMGVWVLLPHQLSGLSVLTSGGWIDDFALSLMGLSLRAGAGARPRLLARVPVTIGH